MEYNEITLRIIDMLITFITAVFASSGMWLFIERRKNVLGSSKRLLVGLAHDRIVFLCQTYLERGFLCMQEYENLYDFLYVPYRAMGQNGTVEHLMNQVCKLNILSKKQFSLKMEQLKEKTL